MQKTERKKCKYDEEDRENVTNTSVVDNEMIGVFVLLLLIIIIVVILSNNYRSAIDSEAHSQKKQPDFQDMNTNSVPTKNYSRFLREFSRSDPCPPLLPVPSTTSVALPVAPLPTT